jgi:hypothetical protein
MNLSRLHGWLRWLKVSVVAVGAWLLVAAAVVTGGAPASALVSGRVSLSATTVPANLVPTQHYASTVSATNTGRTRSAATLVDVVLPEPARGGPRVTFVDRKGISCTGLTTMTQVCKVPGLSAGSRVVVGTLTGTPPATTGSSGVSISATVRDTVNTVTVAWHWLPTLAELTGTLDLTPSSMYLGQYVTATLTIANAGYAPAGTFESIVPIVNPATPETLISQSANTSCIPYDSELDCYTAALARGAKAEVVISYEPGSGPSLTLTGSLDAFDQVPQVTRAGDTLTSNTVAIAGTGADLSVVATNAASTPQGSNLARTITVTDTGDTPAYNVVVQDWSRWFPLVPTGSASTCAVFYTSSGGRVPHPVRAGTRCTLGEVDPGASARVSFIIEVSPTQAAATYSNPVHVLTTTPHSTSPGGTATVVVTVPTGPVGPALLVPPAPPSGYTVSGDILTAATGSWNGTAPFIYSFQWLRCDGGGLSCADIPNATGPTYLVQASDVGSTIATQVTASNGGGSALTVSAPTAIVIAARAPVNTYVPVVTPRGEPALGVTYDASAGLWSGTPVISYGYQWLRCDAAGQSCVPIAGATGTSYVLTAADLDGSLEVAVTAANSGGSQTAVSQPASTGT